LNSSSVIMGFEGSGKGWQPDDRRVHSINTPRGAGQETGPACRPPGAPLAGAQFHIIEIDG
jgi:hypothetical protein